MPLRNSYRRLRFFALMTFLCSEFYILRYQVLQASLWCSVVRYQTMVLGYSDYCLMIDRRETLQESRSVITKDIMKLDKEIS